MPKQFFLMYTCRNRFQMHLPASRKRDWNMDANRLTEIMSNFSNARILVIGDLMLDEYLWGNVDRISPEAPVQVVDIRREDLTLGGAGNVIANLTALGGGVDVAGVIGDDPEGEWILGHMKSIGVGQEFIIKQGGRPTIKKTRVIAVSQQVVRIDRETRSPIPARVEGYFIERISENIGQWHVIIISDYGKGLLTKSLLERVIQIARENGVMTIVDPKGRDFTKYKGASLLTPNKKEALLAMGIEDAEDYDLKGLGGEMIGRLDLDGLVITLGAEGMYIFSCNTPPRLIPTRAREVYDVSGAGDTVVAAMALCLAGGADLALAAEIANLAAGVVVGKMGTATVSQEEILSYIDKRYTMINKIIKSHDELLRVLSLHRQRGEKVVFTNGCFDLIHLGHIKLLHESKSFGDVLVVGLNSDDSVRRLKGPLRPCLDEEERMHIIAALDGVDYVTLFSEDTPLDLIKTIQPEILVKGADYNKGDVVGADVVESYGGEVRLVELVESQSTSGLIQKILDRYK